MPWIPWICRQTLKLTQVAAAQWAAKCVRPIVSCGQTAPRHVISPPLGCYCQNQGRKILGAVTVLTWMKVAAFKLQVMQLLMGIYREWALVRGQVGTDAITCVHSL